MIKDYSLRPQKERKGELDGDCNVTACDSKSAIYYNHSTLKYYCESCASRINSDPFNAKYARENFGHPLCTKEELL